LAGLNQIILLSSLIFTLGLVTILQDSAIQKLRSGLVIVFCSILLNFTAFSEFNAATVEGQAIGITLILFVSIHLFIQFKLGNGNDSRT